MRKILSSIHHSKSYLIAAITIGGALEWFQIGLFQSWSLTFDQDSISFEESIAQSLNVFLILGVAVLYVTARISGGIFFGREGDREGPRRALFSTLKLATWGVAGLTLLAWVLPYDIWLTYSTVFFVIIRCFQGMPAGGELPGAICYLAEASEAPETESRWANLRYMCSFALLAPHIGLMLSNSLCLLLQSFLPREVLVNIGWRIVLPLAAILGWIVCHMREKLDETRPFQKIQSRNEITASPIKTVLKEDKGKIFFGFLISIFEVVAFSVLSALPYFYAKDPFYLSGKVIIVLQFGAGLFCVLLLPTIGRLSSKYTSFPWVKTSAWGTIFFCLPLYYFLLAGNFIFSILTYFIMLFFFSIQAAILPSILAALFPVKVRYTGIAFSFNICDGILWSLIISICMSMLRSKNTPDFIIFLPLAAIIFLIVLWVYRKKGQINSQLR